MHWNSNCDPFIIIGWAGESKASQTRVGGGRTHRAILQGSRLGHFVAECLGVV